MAGLAEVIKYGLICDHDFYQYLLSNINGLVVRNKTLLAEAIYRSCKNKAKVVAIDERESGIRAILNLGHTFGHAIETAQGYGNWLHGEAVAVGMVLAADLSQRMGWISTEDVRTLEALLESAHLPVKPPEMKVEQFLELMAVDKKVLDGQLRLVLLKNIGEAFVSADFSHDKLRSCLLGRLDSNH
jgi:3-dehydroquinate synthase